MSNRVRLQVDTADRTGMSTIVEYIDVVPVDDSTRSTVASVIDEFAEATGLHSGNAALLLLSEVVHRVQDERAYEREAERRGVLF